MSAVLLPTLSWSCFAWLEGLKAKMTQSRLGFPSWGVSLLLLKYQIPNSFNWKTPWQHWFFFCCLLKVEAHSKGLVSFSSCPGQRTFTWSYNSSPDQNLHWTTAQSGYIWIVTVGNSGQQCVDSHHWRSYCLAPPGPLWGAWAWQHSLCTLTGEEMVHEALKALALLFMAITWLPFF